MNMTEKEAINELETSIDLAKICTQTYERKKEIEAYKIAIQALEEIQQYRAIGTVEEFKALKENELEILLKDGQSLYQLGLVEGYNKAIEEFAKEIRDWQIDIQDNEYDADKFDFVFERIFEIAEQMKGGPEC